MLVLGILCAVTIVFIFIYLYLKLKRWIAMGRKVNQFPGFPGHPMVGIQRLLAIKTSEELFGKIREMWKIFPNVGPIRRWMLHIPIISMSEAEDVERIISKVSHLRKGLIYKPLMPWLGTGLLTSSGQKWHHRRKILTPTFHFNILQKFLKIFNVESRRLVEVLKGYSNQEIDVVPVITKFTLNSICETAMGISLNNLKGESDYRKAIHAIGNIAVTRTLKFWLMSDILYFFSKTYWFQRKIVKYLHKFSSSAITERKKDLQEFTKHQNVLSYAEKKRVAMLDLLLMNQKEKGDIDDEGIREEVDTFMFEGHDTTAMSICYTLMILANNRDCQDKIYEELLTVFEDSDREPTHSDLQELKYMELCIKESLRLYPSVPLISRIASSDIETKRGHIIPEGCTIVIHIYDLHRRPEVFPNPEVFDPDRFLPENITSRHPYAYIPFSAGPRNCIGKKFAMMELKCCLTAILKNFILEPVDTPESLKFVADLVLRTSGPVRVKFVPRNITDA